MNGANHAALDAVFRTAARLGPQRTLATRIRGAVEGFLADHDLSFAQKYLVIRPIIALAVAATLFLQGDRLPGSYGVLAACGFAIAYNFFLWYLVARRRIYLLRVASILLDNGTVLAASLYFFHELAAAGRETDVWLIYLILIITNGLYYGPIGSLFFAAFWSGVFLYSSLAQYPADTYVRDQLPVRMVFFVLTSFVAMSLAAQFRQRRQHLEQKNRQTLSMLAQIVEARDTDAGVHLQHIQHYSRALALRLGLDEREADEIAYAAMIHDVGKAQVPDAILKKPGALSPLEREEIQRHTEWGGALLSESKEFETARAVARWHHERWDGTGYPDGLQGEEIPLAARIVAVADVYDALISKRPYKAAWPHADAIAEIRRLAGTHLDPRIVEAFLDLYGTNVLRDLDHGMQRTPVDGLEAAA
ncbi:MAG TPA: HD-GYP domain-containing protein [Dehalococcoidia bacterium]|nr:HD-GYP domain-containing protein [Dehalococcoidia bacterium]